MESKKNDVKQYKVKRMVLEDSTSLEPKEIFDTKVKKQTFYTET